MRDCTYTSHNRRDWQLASNSLKSASTATPPRSQVASCPGQAGLEVWITCEFLGRVPTGGSPQSRQKLGYRLASLTSLTEELTDPTSKHHYGIWGCQPLGLPAQLLSPCRGLLRVTTMTSSLDGHDSSLLLCQPRYCGITAFFLTEISRR